MPAAQTWPALQALPQAPQFLLSVCRLAQVPLQSVSPLWQERAHVPAAQTWPALQALPQAPQFLPSVCRLAQKAAPASWPSHRAWPVGQESRHLPLEQTCPALQALSQAPQFLESWSRATHRPLQREVPLVQAGMSGVCPSSTAAGWSGVPAASMTTPVRSSHPELARANTINRDVHRGRKLIEQDITILLIPG